MSDKNQIISLLTLTPLSNKEIALEVGCTPQYVGRLRKNINIDTKTKLDLGSYLHAILSGITTKQELAQHFGVNRRTINRFEQINNTRKKISRYMFISGKDVDEIRQIFRLTTEEVEALQTLPTIKAIQADLKIISAVLHPLTSTSSSIALKHANVNELLRKL